MTAVARVLPRHWDGRRLLRFLTGLAMLTLAFTTPAAPATPVAASSVAVSETVTVAETPVAVSEPAPAPSAVRPPAAPLRTEILALVVLGSLVVLASATLRVHGERAPPAI